MSDDGLVLSDKHGMNPTIAVCFFCGQSKDEIILTGRAGEKIAKKAGHPDGAMPMYSCVDKVPCETCAKYMENGIIVIETEDNPVNREYPERTGNMWVMGEKILARILDGKTAKAALETRAVFVERSVVRILGLVE